MQFEVIPPVVANVTADPDWMVAFATSAEKAGFDGIVVPEHVAWVRSETTEQRHDGMAVVTGPYTMFPDPLALLSFLAGATTSLRLATGILILPSHHPVVMAKRLATLDVLAKGRVRLGIGVGWNPDEMRLCGQGFANRGRRTDEAIQILRLLWSGDPGQAQEFTGEHYCFRGVYCNPKPARGSIPIHIGGSSVAAARRAGRLGDGFQPLNLDAGQLAARAEIMRAAAAESGRDPASLEITVRHSMSEVTMEGLEADRQSGVTRIVVSGSATSDCARAVDELYAFGRRMGLR